MIKHITRFFEAHFIIEEEADQDHGIEFATAALLIEVARSDDARREVEQASILRTLQSLFEFSEEELENLVAMAEEAIEAANDLHQFTRLVNEHYDYAARKKLVTYLWRVAYADGRIDKFEEHIIRRISGLLHLDNVDFVQAKVIARDAANVERG